MIRLFTFHFRSNPVWLNWIYAVSAVGVTAWLDYLSGPRILLSVFYIIPVSFASWFISRKAGFTTAVLSESAWLVTDLFLRPETVPDVYFLWNAAVRLAALFLAAYVFSRLQEAIRREHELALVDGLTGLTNSRGFRERANVEIDRMARLGEVFTMVYFDLDNFKTVNDTLGHQRGDDLLRSVSDILQSNLRKVDIPARLGGDEFAILLTGTRADQAKTVLQKIKSQFDLLMKTNNWPVTVSFGAVGFEIPPYSVNEMITLADQLMYEVKKSGKNNIAIRVVKDRRSHGH